jgi:hypothetical protein
VVTKASCASANAGLASARTANQRILLCVMSLSFYAQAILQTILHMDLECSAGALVRADDGMIGIKPPLPAPAQN